MTARAKKKKDTQNTAIEFSYLTIVRTHWQVVRFLHRYISSFGVDDKRVSGIWQIYYFLYVHKIRSVVPFRLANYFFVLEIRLLDMLNYSHLRMVIYKTE